jgi:hypothetical protein
VKIRWTRAAAASARRFIHDQDGMRAIGVVVAGLAEDPLPADGFHRARTAGSESTATGFCV